MRTLSSESPNHVRQATVDLSRADPQYLWNPSSTMGKCQSPPLSAEMNVGNNNPELGGFMPEKKLSDGDDIATVSLFSNYEDVEKLKCEMREVVVEVNTRSPPNTGNKLDSKSTTNDHLLQPRLEMSSSLPNLSVITEKGSEILSKLSQRIISTSAADVRKSVASSGVTNSPDNLCSSCNDGTLDCASDRSMNLVHDKELESLSPQTGSGETGSESGSDNTMTVTTSCNSINSNGDVPSLNVSKHNTDKVQSKERNTNTLTLSIDSNNSKLSTVLENIPLMYIPKTKQLVPCNNCDTMVNALSMQTSSPCETSSLPGECSTTITPSLDDVDAHSDMSSHTQMNTSFSSASNILDISVSSCTALLDDATCDAEKDEERDFLSKLELNGKTESPCSTLPRSTTAGSLGQTDTSSYSSISSLSLGNGETSANASISDESNLELRSNGHSEFDDTAFMEVNLDGRNSFEKCRNPSQDSGIVDANDTNGAKPKRRSGFSSFFSRSLFSKKPKDQESAPGWKLFGKVTPKEVPTKNPNQITEEYQANQRALARKKDIEVTSTTALILENRPSGLPCKTPEEELKHRQQYEAMVEAAKKKEQKEAKQKKKQMQQLLKLEEKMTHALKIWNEEILPSWESMSVSKKAKDLWWIGLPPSVRGKVWTLAIGNELNITPELYEICVSRAEDRIRIMSEGDSDSICSNEPASSKEASVDLIKLDVSRTFPQLCIFQRGGPYHDLLHSLLGAYACYRPDVGYVQGMSFIAAVLLLNMEVADAFICFANLLNKPCQVTFFRMDESIMKAYFVTYEEFFEENLPRLYNHFVKQKLTPDLYIIDWMFTLFSKSLPLDVASRVWDVFCRDSEEFLFRTALGILKLHEPVLLNLDFIHLAQFLTRLPENISSEKLFMNIRQIEMTIDSRKYSQVLATNRDNLKDG